MSEQIVAAFYRFLPLRHLAELQGSLRRICYDADLAGIVLIAPEGINATISGERTSLLTAMDAIAATLGVERLEAKFSPAPRKPFKRMKVRIKKEIVTIGDATVNPAAQVGSYVEPSAWNALISNPDVLLIDTRNAYEVAIGSFASAIDPGTRAFGEFPDFVKQQLDPAKHKKIAMYCTGGIRCEKASSFLLQQGFDEVYHLKGGILSYLETVPASESLWQGGCFVFDERVAIGHGLEPLPIRLCLSCDSVLTETAMVSPLYEEGVSCPACAARLSETQKASARERQRQMRKADVGK